MSQEKTRQGQKFSFHTLFDWKWSLLFTRNQRETYTNVFLSLNPNRLASNPWNACSPAGASKFLDKVPMKLRRECQLSLLRIRDGFREDFKSYWSAKMLEKSLSFSYLKFWKFPIAIKFKPKQPDIGPWEMPEYFCFNREWFFCAKINKTHISETYVWVFPGALFIIWYSTTPHLIQKK